MAFIRFPIVLLLLVATVVVFYVDPMRVILAVFGGS
jgi:hypothetical protein